MVLSNKSGLEDINVGALAQHHHQPIEQGGAVRGGQPKGRVHHFLCFPIHPSLPANGLQLPSTGRLKYKVCSPPNASHP